jgi:hypothetical protein
VDGQQGNKRMKIKEDRSVVNQRRIRENEVKNSL